MRHKTLNEKLVEAKQASGLTDMQIAMKLGVGLGGIKAWLAGEEVSVMARWAIESFAIEQGVAPTMRDD